MSTQRIMVVLMLAVAVLAFFVFDLQTVFTLENLKAQHHTLVTYRIEHPFLAMVLYWLLYIAVTSLSLPGATLLTLAGGAVFGLWWGTFIVSFASSIGATLAFLVARFLCRDWVEAKFGNHLQTINEGIAKEGAFYLFTLRLIPLFPFFMINLVMGLTVITTQTFYWVSQIGMLAGTLVYVNAGTQLAKITSLSNILTPALIGSFALLGLFPLLAKKALALYESSKQSS